MDSPLLLVEPLSISSSNQNHDQLPQEQAQDPRQTQSPSNTVTDIDLPKSIKKPREILWEIFLSIMTGLVPATYQSFGFLLAWTYVHNLNDYLSKLIPLLPLFALFLPISLQRLEFACRELLFYHFLKQGIIIDFTKKPAYRQFMLIWIVLVGLFLLGFGIFHTIYRGELQFLVAYILFMASNILAFIGYYNNYYSLEDRLLSISSALGLNDEERDERIRYGKIQYFQDAPNIFSGMTIVNERVVRWILVNHRLRILKFVHIHSKWLLTVTNNEVRRKYFQDLYKVMKLHLSRSLIEKTISLVSSTSNLLVAAGDNASLYLRLLIEDGQNYIFDHCGHCSEKSHYYHDDGATCETLDSSAVVVADTAIQVDDSRKLKSSRSLIISASNLNIFYRQAYAFFFLVNCNVEDENAGDVEEEDRNSALFKLFSICCCFCCFSEQRSVTAAEKFYRLFRPATLSQAQTSLRLLYSLLLLIPSMLQLMATYATTSSSTSTDNCH